MGVPPNHTNCILAKHRRACLIVLHDPIMEKRDLGIVDDCKVNHFRQTYKEKLFLLNNVKINLKILRYIKKHDFIKKIN